MSSVTTTKLVCDFGLHEFSLADTHEVAWEVFNYKAGLVDVGQKECGLAGRPVLHACNWCGGYIIDVLSKLEIRYSAFASGANCRALPPTTFGRIFIN